MSDAAMKTTLRAVRVLSDGRPGHENQSTGLAEALRRRTGADIETVRITGGGYFSRYGRATSLRAAAAVPNLVIGVGHATHLPLIYAARRFNARSVVIMKPTWPMSWFDLCLVPAHDLKLRFANPGIELTRGALTRIPETIPSKQSLGLVLLGGASRHHGWDENGLLKAVQAVVAARPDLEWVIGDSRRTPSQFLPRLEGLKVKAQFVPHQRTTPEWLPTQLLAAQEAWVTEDSISMIHEAVTAGARTGVLPAPTRKEGGRVLDAVRGLVADGFVTTFEDWQRHGRRLSTPKRLHETARCAELVLERFFREARA